MDIDDEPAPAISYVQVVSPDQMDESVILDIQRSEIKKTAAILGYKIVREYVEVINAAEQKRRPVFWRMIADCHAHDTIVEGMFAYDWSHVFWCNAELESHFREFSQLGIDMQSA